MNDIGYIVGYTTIMFREIKNYFSEHGTHGTIVRDSVSVLVQQNILNR